MSRDDDIELTAVPEADAAEQQAPLDPDEVPDDLPVGDEVTADLDRASEADVLEQHQSVTGDEDYPRAGSDDE
jgi:hypothetical protein